MIYRNNDGGIHEVTLDTFDITQAKLLLFLGTIITTVANGKTVGRKVARASVIGGGNVLL